MFPEKWYTANCFPLLWYFLFVTDSFTNTVCTFKIEAYSTFICCQQILHKAKALVYLMAFQIKLMTVLAFFKAQDFQGVSCSGKLALRIVSSCGITAEGVKYTGNTVKCTGNIVHKFFTTHCMFTQQTYWHCSQQGV